ncbi:MAG: pyridoxal phosphate-dependent aminotransferase [Sulfolobales archaeon]|nr:pyridoxal phosphate-dependent aminotransferase [Sulfolobales archaeon]MDT7905019.1 pyridoxal phosphate-dependent aminotransferase [Sulfolobales archaeon]
MDLSFSKYAEVVSGESTLVYSDLARKVSKEKGFRIINFGIGQPDLPTFEPIRNEAIKALEEGFTGYTPAAGIDELRSKVAEHLTERYGDRVRKEEVIITPGAKTALFLAFLLTINPGDEVIIPDPSFYSYAEVVKMLGGVVKYVPMRWSEESGFSLDIESIESQITSKTRMIVFNNPHNPTGTLFSPKEVEELVRIAREKRVWLLSDEIYDYFVYEGQMRSVLQDSDWRSFVLYVNGFSKTFSMTGWRLGYLVAREEMIRKAVALAANIYTCPTSFAQKGALAAFQHFDLVKQMIDLFKRRRDVMFSELKKVKGIRVSLPRGAFYMFPNISEILRKKGWTSKDFSVNLIQSKGVTTIPGDVFSPKVGKDFVRLSFALDENDIREGVQRIKEFVDEILSG